MREMERVSVHEFFVCVCECVMCVHVCCVRVGAREMVRACVYMRERW